MTTEKYELPLYRKSLSEAYQNNESELWLVSHRLNIECKEAIEQLVREHFSGYFLDGEIAVRTVEKYGLDRVGWVLANTAQHHDWDGRFRPHNKAWAKEFPIPADSHNRTYEFVLSTHPEIVNGLIDQYREYAERIESMDESELPPWAKRENNMQDEHGFDEPTML